MLQCFGQPWPVCFCPRGRISVGALATGLVQGVELKVRRLLTGRNTSIAELYTPIISQLVKRREYRDVDYFMSFITRGEA